MSSNGLGQVAPVQNGSGKVHILADYSDRKYGVGDTSDTRCGKLAAGWTRLEDTHCLVYSRDPKSCKSCARMLAED